MVVSNILTNPVNLQKLRNTNFLNDISFNLVLKDDIWKKGILILRGGKYLTETIVDKLLNFGVYEVNVHLNCDDYQEDELKAVEELKRNYISSQNVLIIDKSFKEVGYLAKSLIKLGFKERNIYGAIDVRAIDKYLKDKIPNYLFINYDSELDEYIKVIKKIQIFSNTHIFLTSTLKEDGYSLKELEDKASFFDTKLIVKPIIFGHLMNLTKQCIDQDFCRLLNNEKSKEDYKFSMSF